MEDLARKREPLQLNDKTDRFVYSHLTSLSFVVLTLVQRKWMDHSLNQIILKLSGLSRQFSYSPDSFQIKDIWTVSWNIQHFSESSGQISGLYGQLPESSMRCVWEFFLRMVFWLWCVFTCVNESERVACSGPDDIWEGMGILQR